MQSPVTVPARHRHRYTPVRETPDDSSCWQSFAAPRAAWHGVCGRVAEKHARKPEREASWTGFTSEVVMKRRQFLRSMTALAAGSVLPMPAIVSARAQSRQETLLIVSESGPNNLDIHGVGTNVPGYEASWNCYDRLISHEMKALPNGTPYYDRDKLKPELAEDMNVGDMSVTFKLKKNATFHDGTAVTAKDVKWSLDRAVTVGGFPTFQMGAGSLEKPEQFVVVDDRTVRVDFLRKDRLTVPDLAVIVPCVLNSGLVQRHATE